MVVSDRRPVSAQMQFDRAKLRAAILHTCRAVKPERLGAVKLHKVLYFLDMIHYAQTGRPVTGAIYKKRPFGPTCVPMLPVLREMELEGLIRINEVMFHGLRKKEYIALQNAEAGILNEPEIDLLNEVIEFVCDQNSARSISEFSHQLPWEMADFGEVISYQSALLLFPAQISPEALETVAGGGAEIKTARSKRDAMVFTDLAAFRGRIQSQSSAR